MKTILYQPLFINPQAYFVFPYWTNAVKADRTLLFGASAGYGSSAGFFALASSYDLGAADANVGTRLVYIP